MRKIKNSTGRKIPLNNFKDQYKRIQKKIDKKVKEVLSSGWYILGNEVKNFERNISKYIGVKYVIGVASGTDALTIACKILDLKPSDGVIVPANVYPSVFGIHNSGVKVQLADVDESTLNLTLNSLKIGRAHV